MVWITNIISLFVTTKTMFKLFPALKADIAHQLYWGHKEYAFNMKKKEVYILINNELKITTFENLGIGEN